MTIKYDAISILFSSSLIHCLHHFCQNNAHSHEPRNKHDNYFPFLRQHCKKKNVSKAVSDTHFILLPTPKPSKQQPASPYLLRIAPAQQQKFKNTLKNEETFVFAHNLLFARFNKRRQKVGQREFLYYPYSVSQGLLIMFCFFRCLGPSLFAAAAAPATSLVVKTLKNFTLCLLYRPFRRIG